MAHTQPHNHKIHHSDKDSKQSGGGGFDTSQHGRILEDDVLPEVPAEVEHQEASPEDSQSGGGGLEVNQHGRDLEDKEGHAGPQDRSRHRHH